MKLYTNKENYAFHGSPNPNLTQLKTGEKGTKEHEKYCIYLATDPEATCDYALWGEEYSAIYKATLVGGKHFLPMYDGFDGLPAATRKAVKSITKTIKIGGYYISEIMEEERSEFGLRLVELLIEAQDKMCSGFDIIAYCENTRKTLIDAGLYGFYEDYGDNDVRFVIWHEPAIIKLERVLCKKVCRRNAEMTREEFVDAARRLVLQ